MVGIEIYKKFWSRRFFYSLWIRGEIAKSWRGTYLGPLWSLLGPLSIVFFWWTWVNSTLGQSEVGMVVQLPRMIFSAFLWSLFVMTLSRVATLFMTYRDLFVSLDVFPSELILMWVLRAFLMWIGVVACVFFPLKALGDCEMVRLIWSLFSALPLIFIGASIGALLCVFVIFFPDIEKITPHFLYLLFAASPALYTESPRGEFIALIAKWNPLNIFFQIPNQILRGESSASVGLVLLLVGMIFFHFALCFIDGSRKILMERI